MSQAVLDTDTAAARPMDLLRFATAGSVDDGKSTLIGRLLFDTKTIFACVSAGASLSGDSAPAPEA